MQEIKDFFPLFSFSSYGFSAFICLNFKLSKQNLRKNPVDVKKFDVFESRQETFLKENNSRLLKDLQAIAV